LFNKEVQTSSLIEVVSVGTKYLQLIYIHSLLFGAL